MLFIGHALLAPGAIEGEFLRSVAHVLVVSFRTKIEHCLCGKSTSGTWSVAVTGPVSPITDLPRAKFVRGHPPPPMDMLPV